MKETQTGSHASGHWLISSLSHPPFVTTPEVTEFFSVAENQSEMIKSKRTWTKIMFVSILQHESKTMGTLNAMMELMQVQWIILGRTDKISNSICMTALSIPLATALVWLEESFYFLKSLFDLPFCWCREAEFILLCCCLTSVPWQMHRCVLHVSYIMVSFFDCCSVCIKGLFMKFTAMVFVHFSFVNLFWKHVR